MVLQYMIVGLLLAFASSVAVVKNKLTMAAGVWGGITGFIIFIGSGWMGIAMLATFFVLGTASTSFGIGKKQQLGLVSKEESKRTTGQVFANAGVAAMLSLLMILFPAENNVLLLMLAASFASATADTMSSELGNVFGSYYFNIITFKKDKRGLDGVVSLEGTLIGLCGSAVIALLYACFYGFDKRLLIIVIAGAIGNIADSVLGATAERRGILTNNQINFLNTLAGAIVALGMWYYIG